MKRYEIVAVQSNGKVYPMPFRKRFFLFWNARKECAALNNIRLHISSNKNLWRYQVRDNKTGLYLTP